MERMFRGAGLAITLGALLAVTAVISAFLPLLNNIRLRLTGVLDFCAEFPNVPGSEGVTGFHLSPLGVTCTYRLSELEAVAVYHDMVVAPLSVSAVSIVLLILVIIWYRARKRRGSAHA